MIYKNIKKAIARRMKLKSFDEYDREVTSGKMPRRYSVYKRGKRDMSDEVTHGRYTGQGLSNYIEDMLKAEKEGKFKLK